MRVQLSQLYESLSRALYEGGRLRKIQLAAELICNGHWRSCAQLSLPHLRGDGCFLLSAPVRAAGGPDCGRIVNL